jgi:hypothetical protein
MSHHSPPPAEHAGRSPAGTQAGSAAVRRPARWPAWARRGPMEIVACAVIALGVAMMLQPFALVLYTYSFVTTLAGVVMFTIVSKFPE